ncbi:efflux RND transporter periplasmic adaptor subunit [Thalassotalea sp. HSM 43]|uniref:efflux RND transporter periplasmic adaptor subunit n=1 Tax=Thalassotalea sp. HSM 43 TaxID=2552945 RepID=UPI0010812909|nr:efflux RND transporter periplasmic adaptor subunit [Thalassotalea sp. HSM 43]QBY03664.1 efflux RND transporter periplasmic adaptor subunit [Thalassotalea sp. HSM 43]
MKLMQWLITLVMLSAVVFGLFSYKQALTAPADADTEQFEPAATVDAEKVQQINFQRTSKVHGELVAIATLQLRNQLSGTITYLNLPFGQQVEKGQLLIELDHSNEKAQLIAAKARLTLAQQTVQRYRKLEQGNEISQELLDKAISELAIAKSEVALLEATIAKKVIKAPFTATVGLHKLVVGQYLDSNSDIVTLLGDDQNIWVEFSLPQTFSPLKLDQAIQIHTLGTGQQFTAKIIASEPVFNKQSRQLGYRAKLPRQALNLKPQSLVNVEVPVSAASSQFSVADIALTHDQFGDYVFVLEPQDDGSYRARRTKVQVIERQNAQAIITSGIEAQQIIATQGAFKLRDGMKVFIKQLQG